MNDLQYYTKAYSLAAVDNAVDFNTPIGSDHPFYTDFSSVRGDRIDNNIFGILNLERHTLVYDDKLHQNNKTLLFLAGMRGSGKTSELEKLAKKLNHPDRFFCVTCNLDEGLDQNNLEYMDVLIFQLERLSEELDKLGIEMNIGIIETLQSWFSERVKEVNKLIKKEGGFEVEIKSETPSFFHFFSMAGKVKASVMGNKENAEKIRTVFKSRFTDFAKKINEFFERINSVLRENKIARELLFIIDGIEKTEYSQKVILDEGYRIKQIKVNTIFTLPIELMPETRSLMAFSTVVPFPFVKIREKDGSIVELAIQKFIEFTEKRIDLRLFDSIETVRKAILFGGGSPREYLRVLEYANLYADENKDVIDEAALQKAVKKLAAQTAQYLSKGDLKLLQELKTANAENFPIEFGAEWQDLLQKLIVLEYNDGTYKRVNPVIEESELYKYYVK